MKKKSKKYLLGQELAKAIPGNYTIKKYVIRQMPATKPTMTVDFIYEGKRYAGTVPCVDNDTDNMVS